MFWVKSIILFSFIAVISGVPTGEDDERAQMIRNAYECKEEFKITGDLVPMVNNDEDKPENVKCFLNCLYEKNGIIANGEIQRDVFVKVGTFHANAEIVNQVADACAEALHGDNACDAASNLLKCVVRKMKELNPNFGKD